MILVGCQNEININSCIVCKFKNYPHRCNVYREETLAEKIFTWEWIETPESSNIEMFAYEGNVLRVCFKNGSMYDYIDVPKNVYVEMIVAESKGKFLNSNIKGEYKWVKVE